MIRRREFIIGATATSALPVSGQAQQPTMPVIGWLSSGSAESYADRVVAFRNGLKESGFVEGRNVKIDFCWADGQSDRLSSLAIDLVRHRVAVIVATGGDASAEAAKVETTTIPIVFQIGSDPIKRGLVASLNRPGGNVTGVTNFSVSLDTKRLELLRELVPKAEIIAVLMNQNTVNSRASAALVETAALAIGQQIRLVNASSEQEFEASFANIIQQRAGALLVTAEPVFYNHRNDLIMLAAHHGIPTSYFFREFVAAGGLMSYGADVQDNYRQVGIYTGRILKGEKPGELPVQQSTKVELVINLKTAKALGLDVPSSFYWRADEVIE